MLNDDLTEIIKILQESPIIFKTAITIYNTTEDPKIKKELGQQIKLAKESFQRLDVLLEDLQWDFESEIVENIINKLN